MSALCPVTKARSLISRLVAMKRFDKILEGVEPIGGTAGNLVYEMRVKPEHANNFDTLHGGMSAYLIDALSTVSQVTLGVPQGVSSGIQINYYRAAAVGSTVRIETQTVMRGRNLYYSNILFKDKESGKPILQGCHSKFVGGAFATADLKLPPAESPPTKLPMAE